MHVWEVIAPKRRHLVMLLAGTLVVYGLIYAQIITGEAYEFARGFVADDERVTKVTGPQSSQRLSFWSGFDYSIGSKDGEASMTLRVIGQRGEFELPMTLVKRQGRWDVVSAKAISASGSTAVIVE